MNATVLIFIIGLSLLCCAQFIIRFFSNTDEMVIAILFYVGLLILTACIPVSIYFES